MRAIAILVVLLAGCAGSRPAPTSVPDTDPFGPGVTDVVFTRLDGEELDGAAIHMKIYASRSLLRAADVVVKVGDQEADVRGFNFDGSLNALLHEEPRVGDRVHVGWTDGIFATRFVYRRP
jgi:hypothetical protein